jgi:hypothetical protein
LRPGRSWLLTEDDYEHLLAFTRGRGPIYEPEVSSAEGALKKVRANRARERRLAQSLRGQVVSLDLERDR